MIQFRRPCANAPREQSENLLYFILGKSPRAVVMDSTMILQAMREDCCT